MFGQNAMSKSEVGQQCQLSNINEYRHNFVRSYLTNQAILTLSIFS